MPWDGCRLLLADIRSGRHSLGRTVAGSPSESVAQPSWGPDGLLYFLSDRTGWWNLYRLRDEMVTAILPIDADCAPAPWEAGYQSYGFAPDGSVVLTVLDGFSTELMAVDPAGGRRRLGPNLTSVKPYIAVDDGRLAVIGSTPSSAPSLWSLDLAAQADAPAVPIGTGCVPAPSRRQRVRPRHPHRRNRRRGRPGGAHRPLGRPGGGTSRGRPGGTLGSGSMSMSVMNDCVPYAPGIPSVVVNESVPCPPFTLEPIGGPPWPPRAPWPRLRPRPHVGASTRGSLSPSSRRHS
ncbi:hypothetical protein GCM10010519_10250 [Streptomyces lactacystinicus]